MANNTNKGFSLIELSIVLIIIGLLVAGVTAGNALIKTAEIRAVAREFEEHKTAVSTFRATYDVLPGDITDANLSASLGSITINNGGLDITGDGDGRIEYLDANTNEIVDGAEFARAWEHLSGANMISSKIILGATNCGCAAIAGVTAPASKLSGGVYYIGFSNFGTTNGLRNIVALGGNQVTPQAACGAGLDYCSQGVITPMDTRNLDNKYDDGNPMSGDVWARNGANVVCLNGSNEYDLTQKDKNCRLSYTLFQ